MATFPVTREQAKDWARELDDAEDHIFDSLIATATITIGEMTGRSLIVEDPVNGSGGPPVVQVDGSFVYNDVPENLRHAILLLVSHWFHNREAVGEKKLHEVPVGISSLVGLSKSGWVGA